MVLFIDGVYEFPMNQKSTNSIYKSVCEYGTVILLLAAAILLFWWHVWIPSPSDRMHFTDDIMVKDYPTRMGLFRQVLDGRLPLWDPYQFGGWPGLANCEAGVFYPLNWPLVPFSNSPELAFLVTEWLVLLHLLIAGLGAYRYARYLGLSPLASSFSAFAFTFCGFFCAHKKHTNMIFTLVWFPWLLLLAERWIRENQSRFLLWLALVFAFAQLAGHPQSSLYMILLIAARLIYGIFEKNPLSTERKQFWFLRGALPILGVLLLSIALSAVQHVPTLELIQQGERSNADVYERSREFSMPPSELLEAFLPEIMSSWSQTEVFYWGLVPILLAIHFVLRGKLQAIDRYLLTVFVAAILLSLGEYLFAYDLSYLLLPGAAWVRAPSRWIFFAGLPLALAAAREIDFQLSEESTAVPRSLSPAFWKIIGTLAAMISIALIFVLLTSDYAVPPESRLAVRQGILRAFLYMLLFGGSFLFLFHLTVQKSIRPAFFAVTAILILWIDLGTQFRTFDLRPGIGGYSIDTEAQKLAGASWTHRTKVFFDRGVNRTLYHGAAQNFYEVDGQSPLTPRLNYHLREDTNLLYADKPNLTLYRMLGVQTLLTDMLDLPPTFTSETQRLYRMESPLPRAFALQERLVADRSTHRDLIKLQSFPWRQVAIVEEGNSKISTAEIPENALFPKPFLLASCSINAVSPNAFLIVDGKNHFADFKENPPGYYFAVADSLTGEIEDAQVFDLMKGIKDTENFAIHKRMLKFIHDIPDGKIVFAAVKDNAANCLMTMGISALREIGASLDIRSGYRLAQAIIGRKGAPIGSALEIFSATEALVHQTEKSIYIEGTVCPKPEPAWQATTNMADRWYAFHKEMNKNQSQSLLYDSSQSVRHATDPLYLPAPIAIFSAPKKEVSFPTEDRASIVIAGREYASNQRGYNLVIVDPKTQKVVDNQVFDLFKDYDAYAAPSYINPASPENRRMRDYIRSVNDGYLILGAIRDDATDLMTPTTLETLHALGSTFTFDMTDANARKRLSHAFIAIKGASNCVESFGKEKDAIIFTRYPGGPALSLDAGQYVPANPLDEMEALIAQSPPAPKPVLPVREWAVVKDDIDRIQFSGQSVKNDLVFISEIFFPGWKAYVDGVQQPILRLNYYFRGVEVTPGRHEIELVYAPDSLRQGAAISAFSLIAVVIWWIALLVNRRWTRRVQNATE